MTDEAKDAFYAKYKTKAALNKAIVQLGMKAYGNIMRNLPALKKLNDLVTDKAARGYLKGLDGRQMPIRSKHAALNTLLQGGGAVVMKKALVLFDEAMAEAGHVMGVDFALLANVHDEFQVECRPEIAEEVGKIAAESIRLAGVAFGLKCPLAGSFDIGRNWKETH